MARENRAGSVSQQVACLTDLMATAAAITNQTLPDNAGEDSYDLLPALTGTAKQPVRESVVHHSADGVFSIRQGDWKLGTRPRVGRIQRAEDGRAEPGRGPKGQFYNLAAILPRRTISG